MDGFKSINSKITDLKKLERLIYEPILYQDTFEKRTTPWDKEKYKDFKFEAKDIDRLYYFGDEEPGDGEVWEVIFRITYKDKPLYIQMCANCDNSGFQCYGYGNFYMSRNPNIFFPCVLKSRHNPDRIYQFLKEDGIQIEKYEPNTLMYKFLEDTIREYTDEYYFS